MQGLCKAFRYVYLVVLHYICKAFRKSTNKFTLPKKGVYSWFFFSSLCEVPSSLSKHCVKINIQYFIQFNTELVA